jgi:hypothetical protein
VRLKPGPEAADIWFDMTTIRTTCPRCGEVDMGPESILLSVKDEGSEGTYCFVCPVCREDVEKQADRKIVALLVSAGVPVAGSPAAEAPSPPASFEEAFAGEDDYPPLTLDDLIQFHFTLQDDDALEEFFTPH